MLELPPERRLPRWAVLVLGLPIQLGWIVMLWAGWRVATTASAWLGLVFIAVAAFTAYLAIRRLIASLRTSNPAVANGDVRGPEFDYLIWSVIGLPILLVVVLLVFLLTSSPAK